jgi:divergent AAA domain protein
MQNPGRFILAADEFRSRILSMPRNPSIIRLFRHPKLSENAGYGIDKISGWKKLTGKSVIFDSDMLISTVTYPLTTTKDSRRVGENNGVNGENNDEKKVLDIIRQTPSITQPLIAAQTGFSTRKVNRLISSLRTKKKIVRIGKTKGGHWEIND